MTIDVTYRGVYVGNESDLDTVIDRLIAAESRVRSLEAQQAEQCGAKKCVTCGHFECQHGEFVGGGYFTECRDCTCAEFAPPADPGEVKKS